jgi:hypothetical protein
LCVLKLSHPFRSLVTVAGVSAGLCPPDVGGTGCFARHGRWVLQMRLPSSRASPVAVTNYKTALQLISGLIFLIYDIYYAVASVVFKSH